MAQPKIIYLGCIFLLMALVEATPPGIANHPAQASCKDRRYKMCYNLVHVCPKFCPDGCEVHCPSCKPICTSETGGGDTRSSPPLSDSRSPGSPSHESGSPGDNGESDDHEGKGNNDGGDKGEGEKGGKGKGDKDGDKGDKRKGGNDQGDKEGKGKGDKGDDKNGKGEDGKDKGDKDGKGKGDKGGKGEGGKDKGDKDESGKGKGDEGNHNSPPINPPPSTPSPPTPSSPTPPSTSPPNSPPTATPSTPSPTPPSPAPKPPTPSSPSPPPKLPTPSPSTPSTPSSPSPPPKPPTPSPSTPLTPSPPSPAPKPPTPSPSTPPTPSSPSPSPKPPTPPPSSPSLVSPPTPSTPSPSTPSTPPPSPHPTPSPSTPSSPQSPPSSPPPSDNVASRKRVRCKNNNYKQCYVQQHVCPVNCPTSCEVDCVTCKPVCSCDYPGAVCQDPRFIGADGVTFYFHGKKDKDFCLVTDPNLHINAHFIGKRNNNMTRDFTWVQSIGVLYDNHRLFVGAQKSSTWDDSKDRLALSFDGEPIFLPETEGSEWRSNTMSLVTITRASSANRVIVQVEGKLKITANVVPITKEESKVHNYGITEEDCFAHLDLGFKFYSLSQNVEGVLGKTYRDDYVSRVKMGISMPVMGGDREYASSNLFATDCLASRFHGVRDEGNSMEELASLNCGSGMKYGAAGVVCKR